MRPTFDGVLFFPVTPFTESRRASTSTRWPSHIAKGVDAGPGGVFIACGTGEFHALERRGVRRRRAHRGRGGRRPGAGVRRVPAARSPRPSAFAERRQGRRRRRAAAAAAVPRRDAAGRPGRLHPRGRRRHRPAGHRLQPQQRALHRGRRRSRSRKIPNVIGFKDGTGDLDQVARIVRAVTTR